MSPPLLVHLHIPKCGGTTVSRMLKSRMLAGAPWLVRDLDLALGLPSRHGLDERLAALDALPENQRRRIRSFEAHCGWGVQHRLPEPMVVFTWLRDPVDRVLSVHHAVQRDGLVRADEPLEAFLERPAPPRPAWQFDNGMVRYLAGEDARLVEVPTGQVTDAMLETAWDRLRSLPVFGLLERFDESAAMLLAAMGWRRAVHRRSNAVERRLRREDLTPAQRDLVTRRTALDAELYRRAAAEFDRRVHAGGKALARRVGAFRSFNARASTLLAPAYAALERRADARRATLRGTAWRPEDAPPT